VIKDNQEGTVTAFIDHLTLEVSDAAAAADFYAGVFGLGPAVRLRASEAPTTDPFDLIDTRRFGCLLARSRALPRPRRST